MAIISSTTRSVCDKLVNNFGNTAGGLTNFANRVSREVANNVTSLKGLSWSGTGDLTAGVGDFISDMNVRIPQSDDVDAILDFINGCDFLKGNSILKNPIGLTNGLIGSIFDKMGSMADWLSDSLSLPELGVGKLFDDIINSLDFSGISVSVPALDSLIGCVSASCGGEFASEISEMTDALDDLFIDFNMDSDPLSPTFGQLDLDSIYDKAAMTVSEKANMGMVNDAFTSIKTEATSKVSECIETIKETTDVFDW
jgi:hypothetical protein